MAVEGQLNPTSLVARIIAELQANPEAQRLLLQALLTNEFLGMPARLARIEQDIAELKADVVELKADVAQLKADVAGLKTDVAGLKTDVAGLKTDVAQLKGSDLENRLQRKIRVLLSQSIGLKRPRIVHGPMQDTRDDFLDQIEDALENGLLTAAQEARITATDFIIRAQRRNGTPVWAAVEASNRVHAGDVRRARATADALHAAFDEEALAVVAGYGIDPLDAKRAEEAGVMVLEVTAVRPN